MATGLQKWSTTAASNSNADSSVNWAEGQSPASVNDSARAMMAAAAKWRDDNNGTLATSGTTAAFTVTSNQASTGKVGGYTIAVQFHATADTSATLNDNGVGAGYLQLVEGTNLSGGEFKSGAIGRFTYISSSTAWLWQGGGPADASRILDGAVSLAKVVNIATNTILGNTSGSAAAPEEITLGAGLSIASATSTAPVISAPAYPPTAAFKNLSIKVTGNSSADIAADFATMATSGSTLFLTLPVSSSINFGTSGAVNALDTGSIASGTFYAVWAIASSTSTTAKGLASTSFTTPTLPSGYTYKARLGAVVTSTSTASTQLMGTWQYGRRAQYINGLAATSALPIPISGSSGSATVPTWTTVSLSNFVPSTAATVRGTLWITGGSGVGIVAPSTSYGAAGSATNPPPVSLGNLSGNPEFSTPFEFLLEGSNIYYAGGASNGISLLGWDDNL